MLSLATIKFQTAVDTQTSKLDLGQKSTLQYRSGKKKKHIVEDVWIRKLKKSDLKLLCKAAQMTVGGTNRQLVEKLEADSFINQLGVTKVAQLCERCTEAHLVTTGSRHDLVLRLIENQFGTSFGPPTELIHQATSPDARYDEFIIFKQFMEQNQRSDNNTPR